MKTTIFSLCILFTLTACKGETTLQSSSGVECLRDCLEAHLENYLQALAGQDLSRINTTEDVVFVENNQVLELGDGSWQTMTGLGSYRHYFADPSTSQVAVISTMRENGQGVIYDLRLKLEGDLIAEIESVVIRAPGSVALYEELGSPPANFLQSIPVAERNTREELFATTIQYFEGMENNAPNIGYPFFDPECNRIEHAIKTTNNDPETYGHSTDTEFVTLTCEEQFDTGFLGFVTRVRDKRYMVIDEERQTVFGLIFLDHNGSVRNITMGDGSNFEVPSYFSTSRTLMVGEAWRIRDQKLLEIEMTLTEFPYGTRPAFNKDDGEWQESSDLNPANLSISSNCDSACLNKLSNDFLAALVAHDISNLPLSPDLVYTENGQRLAVGDGLWRTVTEQGDYQVLLSNVENSEAGYFGSIIETDIPALLSARLQLSEGYINEIDVTVMRHETPDARGNTFTLFAPQLDSMFNPDTFESMGAGINGESGVSANELASLANANALANNTRSSKVLVADADQGLVLQQTIKDISNNSNEEQDTTSSGSYSLLTSNLYSLVDGELVLTKSVSKPIPYKMAF